MNFRKYIIIFRVTTVKRIALQNILIGKFVN